MTNGGWLRKACPPPLHPWLGDVPYSCTVPSPHPTARRDRHAARDVHVDPLSTSHHRTDPPELTDRSIPDRELTQLARGRDGGTGCVVLSFPPFSAE